MSSIRANDICHAKLEAPVLERHRNPLLVAMKLCRSVVITESPLLYRAWVVFRDYVKHKYLSKKGRYNWQDIIHVAEDLSCKVKEKLNRALSDEYIEAAVLLYAVLAFTSRGLEKATGLEEVLKRSFEYCVESSRYLADISSSFILSKCLGLSNFMLEKLSDSAKEFVKSVSERCLSGAVEKYAVFCTYMYFAKTLKVLITRDKGSAEKLIDEVEDWIKRYLNAKYEWLIVTALNMLTYGILSKISGKGCSDMKMALFEKMLRGLDGFRRLSVKLVAKHVWIIAELAIMANDLGTIQYVDENHVVLSRAHLKNLMNFLNRVKFFTSKKIIAIESSASITLIILNMLKYSFPTLIPFPSILICVATLAPLVPTFLSFILKRLQKDVEYLEEALNESIKRS